jgi:hypothetical protein
VLTMELALSVVALIVPCPTPGVVGARGDDMSVMDGVRDPMGLVKADWSREREPGVLPII